MSSSCLFCAPWGIEREGKNSGNLTQTFYLLTEHFNKEWKHDLPIVSDLLIYFQLILPPPQAFCQMCELCVWGNRGQKNKLHELS